MIKDNEKLVPRRKKYTQYDSVRVFLYSLIIPEIVVFVAMLAIGFVATSFGYSSDKLVDNIIYLCVLTLISNASLLGILYYYNKKNKIDTKQAINFDTHLKTRNVFICVILGIVAIVFSLCFINLIDEGLARLGYEFAGSSFDLSNWGGYIIALVVYSLIPAFTEELIYRGMIQTGLSNSISKKKTILFSAIMFSIMHGVINQTVYQFVLGLVLCIVAYKTCNILYTMIIHFTNNFLVVTMSFLSEKYNMTINIMDKMPMWVFAILAIVLFVIGIVVVYYLLRLIKVEGEETKEKIEEQPLDNLSKKYLVLGIVIAVVIWIYNTSLGF